MPRFVDLVVALIAAAQPAHAQSADEAAQIATQLQDGWNAKDGKQFAAAFAPEHDYVAVNGMFLPSITPEANAHGHQRLLDGPFKQLDLALRVAKVRSLGPELGVIHIHGQRHVKGDADEKRGEVIITAVVQKLASGWKIVAFQNTPVLPPGAPAPGS
jgi:uncharacterized protein (TIGR02246 family)